SLKRVLGYGTVSIVGVYIGAHFGLDKVDSLVVDVALVLAVGGDLDSFPTRRASDLGIGKSVTAVAVAGHCERVGIKGNGGAVKRGMGKATDFNVRENVVCHFGIDKVDDLVVDVALVLDVGDHVGDDINSNGIAVGVG